MYEWLFCKVSFDIRNVTSTSCKVNIRVFLAWWARHHMSDTMKSWESQCFGSRPSDHYFRIVSMSVCLFVCAEFFSAVFDPISIKLGHMLYVLCPLEYRGCATPGGWVTPKNLYFYGFWGSKNYLVLQFWSDCADFWLYCRTHQY